ncbi:MAG: DUF4426 domain-containing protein [Pseudomonadales bacterium]
MKPRRLFAPLLLALLLAAPAGAEQKQSIGAFDAHYSLVPTLFLKPEIAARHGITRSRDRALLNVSILDASDVPVQAQVTGRSRNLLGQEVRLQFRQVLDGQAVYYLAEVQHADREMLRFIVDVTTPDSAAHRLEFMQTMYWEGR